MLPPNPAKLVALVHNARRYGVLRRGDPPVVPDIVPGEGMEIIQLPAVANWNKTDKLRRLLENLSSEDGFDDFGVRQRIQDGRLPRRWRKKA
ncbi:MAG: hypothetical protein PWQ41_1957 [Bacillota bacterium]|nr:hypothetical protein [Bacillota bacterium]MDK2960230.1 hypothetical protein [Bacillota bacterium]